MIDEVRFRTHDAGVLVPVRVVPRSSRTEIDGVHDGTVRIRVKAPPVDGAANQELCSFVAKRLGLARKQVEIAAGAQSRSKMLLLRGVSVVNLAERLLTD